MKAKKTFKKIALLTLLTGVALNSKQAYAQKVSEENQIRGNHKLEYFADCIGNQNGKVEDLEADYMKEKFEKADILFACTATPTCFYNGMDKIYTSLKDAWKYWKENPVRGPQAIIGFNKKGEIKKAYRIEDGASLHRVYDVPEIDYKKIMKERLIKYIESIDN